MEIYFYCTYEHSSAGFFLTRFTGRELVPAVNGPCGPPPVVDEFLSYDRFYLLWRDLCERTQDPQQETFCQGAFLGLRSLRGKMSDGRMGTGNLVLLAGKEEAAALKRIALSILGDYDAFVSQVFQWLSAGGKCGYQLDGSAFCAWLERCSGEASLRWLISREDPLYRILPFMVRREEMRTERESLRLAVCSTDWGDALLTLGNESVWRSRPVCALTDGEFGRLFMGRGPLWEMF
ncbi:MAG: hypothetical protein LUH19_06900 [Lachnospiraceae bacterium]|nr:hypothetical protein [Lachnospiraceae bacterium]